MEFHWKIMGWLERWLEQGNIDKIFIHFKNKMQSAMDCNKTHDSANNDITHEICTGLLFSL